MQKVKLENLHCANCAIKIQKSLSDMPQLKNVDLNFSTSTLSFEKNIDKDILNIIEKEIQKIEKDVFIAKDGQKTKKSFWQSLDKWLLSLSVASLVVTYLTYNYVDSDLLAFFGYLAAYLMVGWGVLARAVENISNAKFFDEYFLMSIATIGAFVLGEYVEGIAVMLFYQVGEMFQRVAVDNSRDSINALIDIKPEYAFVKEGDNIVQKSPQEVNIGDIVLIKSGERVPVDGMLLSQDSYFDTSAITGEFKPKSIKSSSEVLSGFINVSNALYVKATSLYGDSTISKIIQLIESASSKKALAEKFITKFASIYTPIVVLLALVVAFVPPMFLEGASYHDYIQRALVFLVISCPCALVISVPLSFFSAIGAVSKRGVLVKGASYIEKLTEIKQMVFDKTGTITKGVFEVATIKALHMSQEDLLRVAAMVESFSSHPIAKSITSAYDGEMDLKKVSFVKEISGFGLRAIVDAKEVLVGNKKLLGRFGINIDEDEILGAIYVAIESKLAGYIVLSDVIKPEAKEFIDELKKLGIKRTYMLSGDKKRVAMDVANSVGIDECRYELLAKDKLKIYEDIKNKTQQTTAFVGDGINDAPTLSGADVGFAMGGIGSALAIKSADVIVLNDNLMAISDAIKIAKKTKVIVYENIIFIMLVKIGFLTLGAGALIGMQEAIFADVGVALIAIFNSMRILKGVGK